MLRRLYPGYCILLISDWVLMSTFLPFRTRIFCICVMDVSNLSSAFEALKRDTSGTLPLACMPTGMTIDSFTYASCQYHINLFEYLINPTIIVICWLTFCPRKNKNWWPIMQSRNMVCSMWGTSSWSQENSHHIRWLSEWVAYPVRKPLVIRRYITWPCAQCVRCRCNRNKHRQWIL